MRVYIARGRKIHGPGDRSYLNSSTEVLEIKKKFPARKKTKIGCAYEECGCTHYKMEIARVPFKRSVFPCDEVRCDEDVFIAETDRLDYTKQKGCKKC